MSFKERMELNRRKKGISKKLTFRFQSDIKVLEEKHFENVLTNV